MACSKARLHPGVPSLRDPFADGEMALIVMRCENAHEYEVLTTVSHCPKDLIECPTCHAPATQQIALQSDRVYTQFLDEGQKADLRENKAWLESNSDKILSGEWSVKENGPREYRPEMPSDMRRYSR